MTTLPSILIASSQTEERVVSSQVSYAAASGRGLSAAAAAEEPAGRGCLQGAGRGCLLAVAAASTGRGLPLGGRGEVAAPARRSRRARVGRQRRLAAGLW